MSPENPLFQFYRDNNISPVHQNIENFRLHMLRREKLYRTLGMPPVLFGGKNILEIGPGGGFNALAFFHWQAMVDFVEPNPRAQAELAQLLHKYTIEPERWSLFPGKIEDYPGDKKYDVVIIEGVIPGMNNRQEILGKIYELINPGGVVVVTCVDEISLFFEVLKRFLAFSLIENQINLTDKVKILSRAFGPHLKQLHYASRPVEDWVTDQFLNPAIHGELFSIVDCIEEFGEQFELLGCSPSLFTDLSWYKDFNFHFCHSIKEQFSHKRHTLLLWNMKISERDPGLNERLLQSCASVRKLEEDYECQQSPSIIQDMINHLNEIIDLTNDLDRRISRALNEVITLLKENKINADRVAKANYFAGAFGRGQQYVSMVRKFTE